MTCTESHHVILINHDHVLLPQSIIIVPMANTVYKSSYLSMEGLLCCKSFFSAYFQMRHIAHAHMHEHRERLRNDIKQTCLGVSPLQLAALIEAKQLRSSFTSVRSSRDCKRLRTFFTVESS